MFSAEILGRFCGASQKMLYTPGSVRSYRIRPILLSELVRRSRKLTVPTSLDRSHPVRPGPNGRGAERGGRVVEKNCIMWVDKLVLWEYTVSRLIGGGREMLQKFEVSELLPWQQSGSDRTVWGPQNT